MQVRHWNGDVKEMTIQAVVKYEVECAGNNSCGGHIEVLQAQVLMLTELVAALVEHAGERVAFDVINRIASYHKPVNFD